MNRTERLDRIALLKECLKRERENLFHEVIRDDRSVETYLAGDSVRLIEAELQALERGAVLEAIG